MARSNRVPTSSARQATPLLRDSSFWRFVLNFSSFLLIFFACYGFATKMSLPLSIINSTYYSWFSIDKLRYRSQLQNKEATYAWKCKNKYSCQTAVFHHHFEGLQMFSQVLMVSHGGLFWIKGKNNWETVEKLWSKLRQHDKYVIRHTTHPSLSCNI